MQLIRPFFRRLQPAFRPVAIALSVAVGANALCVPAGAALPPEWVEQVLALDQRVYALERDALPSQHIDFTVFVGNQRDELRLRRIKLRIGDQAPVAYDYSQTEWEALAAGGVHAVWSGWLAPGEHRLQVELYARELDPTRNDKQIIHRIDQAVAVGPATALELSLAQRRFGSSELQQVPWSDTGVLTSNTENNAHPWLRAGQFWVNAQKPYLAARQFRRLQLRHAGAPWSSEANALAATAVRALSSAPVPAAAEQAAVEQLNAALATLASGNAQPLQLLAAAEAQGETAWMRRDHANLALGYHVLADGDGEGARAYLAQVRSPGPYGNLGLLGFGWSFVQVPAETAAEDGVADASLLPTRPQPSFVTAAHAPRLRHTEARREALHRALVPWTELVGRDAIDPAAQEGALALAWALEELDTGAQAQDYYRRAATLLERARTQLQQATTQARSGELAQMVAVGMGDSTGGWRHWLSDLLYDDDTRYLMYLLLEPEFVEAMDRYRGPRALQEALLDSRRRLQGLGTDDPRSAALDAELRAALDRHAAIEAAARTQMQNVALTLLQAWSLRTERYLAEARFALARQFDYGLEPEVELKREAAAAEKAS